jgi:tagatose 1,6-diphosphate aldolase
VTLSPGKKQHIQALANESGIIAAAAMDQRGSLAKALGPNTSPAMLEEFKTAVSAVLSPHATALLLDPEYGLPATAARDPHCGLLLAYEASGYDNTRPGRLPDLLDHVSVRRIKDWGANAVKLLVYYTPFEDPKVNEIKHAFVERVGAECAAEDLAFFLEFVGYDPAGQGEKSLEYAKKKPEIVTASMAEFSKPQYRVDVLKVEFPVNPKFVEGSRAFSGERAHTRAEALHHFKTASGAASLPFIYLSAGVDNDVFIEQLEMAAEAGSAFSGVLCGRATWKEGIPVYAQNGVEALRDWLASEGVTNINRINNALKPAQPCWNRLPGLQT